MSNNEEQDVGGAVSPVNVPAPDMRGFFTGEVMKRYWGEGEVDLLAAAKKKKKAPAKKSKKPAKKKPSRPKRRGPGRKPTTGGPGCVTETKTCTCGDECGTTSDVS